jgi:RecA-family ATPase
MSVSDQDFETIKVSDIPEPEGSEWLVTDLWSASAVGIIGGEPKSCKTWLGLDIAISVASGTPCLDRFEVPQPGPVLIYLGEDSLWALKQRLTSIAQHRGLQLEELPLYTLPTSRLQLASPIGRYRKQQPEESDQEKLWAKVRELNPKLVLLDPLVRMSQADENSANELNEVLDYLRALQREFHTSVVLTHHARKARPESGKQRGTDLRGSSNLYSWVDSLIFINKDENDDSSLTASVEHRSARSIEEFRLNLVEDDDGNATYLEWIKLPPRRRRRYSNRDFKQLILKELKKSNGPLNPEDLGFRMNRSKDRIRAALKLMEEEKLVRKEGAGYLLI